MTSMKSIHRILALATLAAAALLSQSMQAQSMRVNVPFAFEYANHHFLPGVYTVQLIATGHALTVGNYTGTGMAMVLNAAQSTGRREGYLVFEAEGNRYSLTAYHENGSLTMATVLKSKKDRNRERESVAMQADQGVARLALLENGNTFSIGR